MNSNMFFINRNTNNDGWIVCILLKGIKKHSKTFLDKRFKNVDGSLLSAIRYRDKYIKNNTDKVSWWELRRYNKCLMKNNTSGVTGVSYSEPNSRWESCSGKGCGRYQVTWHTEDRKRRIKIFYVSAYGSAHDAFLAAVEFRKNWEEQAAQWT